MKEAVVLSWSGGKDSALALYELEQSEKYEVSGLLTTVTEDYDRISMHGVRRALLEHQAESLGYPLEIVLISAKQSLEEYEARMRDVLNRCMADRVRLAAFGDVLLEDVRRYREDNLARIGMKAIFPLWQKDTCELARTFIDLGFKAVTTCVDSNFLDKRFVGRDFDRQFLSELPSGVDPCGENGEFHSFVYDGPIFEERVAYVTGDVVLRENRFYFCDLVPA